jgi:Epoxide hydrolase N terminus
MSVTAEPTIRPFRIDVPDEKLAELRRRIEATRWPSRELVDDRSQGVQLATMQALARYWTTEYDFGRLEARLNALPQFTTEIDGLDIHFIHVRSPHEDALPLVMTHGWPGSVVELLETIGPLTAATRRTRSTWCCFRCPATASRASRASSAGTRATSESPGRS